MGAHSTIYVSESTAREVLLRQIIKADNSTLENMMNELLYERLYNCSVGRWSEYEDEGDEIVENIFL